MHVARQQKLNTRYLYVHFLSLSFFQIKHHDSAISKKKIPLLVPVICISSRSYEFHTVFEWWPHDLHTRNPSTCTSPKSPYEKSKRWCCRSNFFFLNTYKPSFLYFFFSIFIRKTKLTCAKIRSNSCTYFRIIVLLWKLFLINFRAKTRWKNFFFTFVF